VVKSFIVVASHIKASNILKIISAASHKRMLSQAKRNLWGFL